MDDWYKITQRDFENFHGSTLLSAYNCSPSRILTTLFPDHQWNLWKFEKSAARIWENKDTRLQFLKYLGDQLGFRSMEDWYKVKVIDFDKYGARMLVLNGSVSKVLADTFTDHKWKLWKFHFPPTARIGDLISHQVLCEYVEELGKHLNINNLNDWYKVSQQTIFKFGGRFLLNYCGGLPGLLGKVYEQHVWESDKFTDFKRKKIQTILKLNH